MRSWKLLDIVVVAVGVGMAVYHLAYTQYLIQGPVLHQNTHLALGLIFLSRTTSLGMFYGAFALVSLGISTCSTTVLITAVANWFRGKVGIATGIPVVATVLVVSWSH